MIKTRVIKENNRPLAVVIDYREYTRLKEIEQDKKDYYSALKVKMENKRWKSHSELKKELGL
jgi:hypothetical protein